MRQFYTFLFVTIPITLLLNMILVDLGSDFSKDMSPFQVGPSGGTVPQFLGIFLTC